MHTLGEATTVLQCRYAVAPQWVETPPVINVNGKRRQSDPKKSFILFLSRRNTEKEDERSCEEANDGCSCEDNTNTMVSPACF